MENHWRSIAVLWAINGIRDGTCKCWDGVVQIQNGEMEKHYPKPGWNAEPRPAVRYSRVVWVVQQLRAAPKPYGFGDRMIWMTDCTKIPNLNLQLLKKIVVFPQMEYSPETMRKMMINHDAPSNFGDSSPVRPQLMCFVSNCQVRAPRPWWFGNETSTMFSRDEGILTSKMMVQKMHIILNHFNHFGSHFPKYGLKTTSLRHNQPKKKLVFWQVRAISFISEKSAGSWAVDPTIDYDN